MECVPNYSRGSEGSFCGKQGHLLHFATHTQTEQGELVHASILPPESAKPVRTTKFPAEESLADESPVAKPIPPEAPVAAKPIEKAMPPLLSPTVVDNCKEPLVPSTLESPERMDTEPPRYSPQREPSFFMVEEMYKYLDCGRNRFNESLNNAEGDEKNKLTERLKHWMGFYTLVSSVTSLVSRDF